MIMEFILLLIMALALLGWVLVSCVQFTRKYKKMVAKSGLKAQVKCESCGKIYEMNAGELTKYWTTKSSSVTKTKREGIALVNRPEYKYYAKKIDCPHCKRTTYAEVLDINQIADSLQKPLFTLGIRTLLQMAIGGFVIMLIVSIPMHFVRLQDKKRAEELERQQYEEVKDRYGL